jgi:hypothetical protein
MEILDQDELDEFTMGKIFIMIAALPHSTNISDILIKVLQRNALYMVDGLVGSLNVISPNKLIVYLRHAQPEAVKHIFNGEREFEFPTLQELFSLTNTDVMAEYLRFQEPNFEAVRKFLLDNPHTLRSSHLHFWLDRYGLRGIPEKLYKVLLGKYPEHRHKMASLDPKIAEMVEKIEHREDMSRQHHAVRKLFSTD